MGAVCSLTKNIAPFGFYWGFFYIMHHLKLTPSITNRRTTMFPPILCLKRDLCVLISTRRWLKLHYQKERTNIAYFSDATQNPTGTLHCLTQLCMHVSFTLSNYKLQTMSLFHHALQHLPHPLFWYWTFWLKKHSVELKTMPYLLIRPIN